jgi:hypothetical protein
MWTNSRQGSLNWFLCMMVYVPGKMNNLHTGPQQQISSCEIIHVSVAEGRYHGSTVQVWSRCLNIHVFGAQLKLKLNYDWQSVGQYILVSGTHLGQVTNFFFLLEIFFRQLRVCYFVASSLMRGRVCNLLLLLFLASTVPRNSRPYFIVPILETPPTWRARSPYLHPPGTGWPRYTPGHYWVPFPSPLTTSRATVEVLSHIHTGYWSLSKWKSKLYYDQQSVSQSVLVSGTHLGPTTSFSNSLFDYFLWQFWVCSLTRSRVCIFHFFPGIASAAFLRSEFHGTHEHSLLSLFFRLPQPVFISPRNRVAQFQARTADDALSRVV